MITLCPILMTPDPQRLRDDLEAQGLVTVVIARTGRWFEMRGAFGGVGVHATAPGSERCELSFVTDDVEATVDRLLTAGFEDAHVWDESYGRVVGVHDPTGRLLWINEAQEDFYGYERGTQDRGTAVVSARVHTSRSENWAHLLRALGMVEDDGRFMLPGDGGTITLTNPTNHESGETVVVSANGMLLA